MMCLKCRKNPATIKLYCKECEEKRLTKSNSTSYLCIMKYKGFNVGDVVELENCTQVRVTHDKHSYGINEFILDMHFEKVEE